MKKILALAVVLALAMAALAYAGAVPTQGTDLSFTHKFNLISSSSGTVTGSTVNLGKPFATITCVVSNATGTDPTSVVTVLSGGIDSANLVTLKTVTSTSFSDIFTTNAATAVPVTNIRGSFTANDGSATRVDCIASH